MGSRKVETRKVGQEKWGEKSRARKMEGEKSRARKVGREKRGGKSGARKWCAKSGMQKVG